MTSIIDQIHARVLTEHAQELATRAIVETTTDPQISTTNGSKGAEGILAAYQRWLTGDPRECPHNPLKQSAAFWAPSHPGMACAVCFLALLNKISGTPEDRTCDLCRSYVPEDANLVCGDIVLDGGADPAGGTYAPVTINFALCERCRDHGYTPPAGPIELIDPGMVAETTPWTPEQFNA